MRYFSNYNTHQVKPIQMARPKKIIQDIPSQILQAIQEIYQIQESKDEKMSNK